MSYSEARIVHGFKELLETLQQSDGKDNTASSIRMNTEARERAIERVRREYTAIGSEPPCDIALSITAREELGYPLPNLAMQEDAA